MPEPKDSAEAGEEPEQRLDPKRPVGDALARSEQTSGLAGAARRTASAEASKPAARPKRGWNRRDAKTRSGLRSDERSQPEQKEEPHLPTFCPKQDKRANV